MGARARELSRLVLALGLTAACGCRGTARGEAIRDPPQAQATDVSLADHALAVDRPDTVYHVGQRTGFLGKAEAAILDRLVQSRIVRIKKGSGGRSLGFKLTLEDGTRGYYKPNQTFSGTNWYAEVVAYYLDRALGLGRVPPLVSRRVDWATLAPAAEGDRRVKEILTDDDGTVRGAFVYWLPGELARARTPPGWENWIRVEPFPRWSVTPFQRASGYAAELRDRKQRAQDGRSGVAFYDDVPKPDTPQRAAELSDLLLFDFLTLNIDRWGGNNANVLTLGAGGPLIFLDNAAGFSPGPDLRGLMDERFRPCERFRKSTVQALKALSVKALGERMSRDPLAPLIDDAMLGGIEVRRQVALEHIAALIRTHGESKVLPW